MLLVAFVVCGTFMQCGGDDHQTPPSLSGEGEGGGEEDEGLPGYPAGLTVDEFTDVLSNNSKCLGFYAVADRNNQVGRVSDSLMSHGQKEPDKYLSDGYSGASYIDKEIVKNVLHFLQSENKNSAIYKYKVPTDCLNGQSLNDYNPSKTNGFAINIFYNQQGKIEAINFARDNYMVTIYNGKLNCVKGGKSIKSIEKK